MAKRHFQKAKNCSCDPLIKGHSPDNLRHFSRQASTPVFQFASNICDILGYEPHTNIMMAEAKSIQSIHRKAVSQCGGDTRKIHDPSRATIVFDNPNDIPKILKLAAHKNNPIQEIAKKSKGKYSILKAPKNNLTRPKRWGYAALYLVGSTRVGRNRISIPFEIQIVPRYMYEHTYKETHPKYEKIRNALEKWEQENADSQHPISIHDVLNDEEIQTTEELLALHLYGMHESGLLKYQEYYPKLDDPASGDGYDIRPDGDMTSLTDLLKQGKGTVVPLKRSTTREPF